MKILALLFILAACAKQEDSERVCKIVKSVGGCNRYYCGVEFTDGTFTDGAERPIRGMRMCRIGSFDYWVHESRFSK
jgi:hypothetical protein